MMNNETRNLSQNMASATYNLLNLPVDMSMVNGNAISFDYLADGRRVETNSSSSEDLDRGGIKRFVSRFTWELPQTLLGYLIGQALNTFNAIGYVGYYDGATVVSTYKGTWGAFTLGSFITAGSGVKADPADKVFQHEYGHYLQSQKFGLLYIPRVTFPSLISASGNGHMRSPVEQDAS